MRAGIRMIEVSTHCKFFSESHIVERQVLYYPGAIERIATKSRNWLYCRTRSSQCILGPDRTIVA